MIDYKSLCWKDQTKHLEKENVELKLINKGHDIYEAAKLKENKELQQTIFTLAEALDEAANYISDVVLDELRVLFDAVKIRNKCKALALLNKKED